MPSPIDQSRITQPQAIDLYSGVGGWDLGLRMAGVVSVGSFEWWGPANDTHAVNFGDSGIHEVDIRGIDASTLPRVDFVVGSPPCTQFSFANRGGNGDIADGLNDIAKFLEVVADIKPRAWAMENVPRVAGILRAELQPGGQLHRFASLVKVVTVVNAAEYGVPQKRKRMIAGSFPLDLLEAYRTGLTPPPLGEVVAALSQDPVVDPVFGTVVPRDEVFGLDEEPALTWEELRMNRDAKRFHPVYNLMPFPDPLAAPARTVTATCTRVSRESIVVEMNGLHRRLTIRERATVQSFPVNFAFAGKSYSDCLKQIGNAIPPVLAYYVVHAMLGTKPKLVEPPRNLGYRHRPVVGAPAIPGPDEPRHRFRIGRTFRAAIPNLRFGSGVRFELRNEQTQEGVTWEVGFLFGTSKAIRNVALGPDLWDQLMTEGSIRHLIDRRFEAFDEARAVCSAAPATLQDMWLHRRLGTHPFAVVDALGALAGVLATDLDPTLVEFAEGWVSRNLDSQSHQASTKLHRYAASLIAGAVVGTWYNLGLPALQPALEGVA